MISDQLPSISPSNSACPPRKLTQWLGLTLGAGTAGAFGLAVAGGLLPATLTVGAVATLSGAAVHIGTQVAADSAMTFTAKRIGRAVGEMIQGERKPANGTAFTNRVQNLAQDARQRLADLVATEVEKTVLGILTDVNDRAKPPVTPIVNGVDQATNAVLDQSLESVIADAIRGQAPCCLPERTVRHIAHETTTRILPIIEQHLGAAAADTQNVIEKGLNALAAGARLATRLWNLWS